YVAGGELDLRGKGLLGGGGEDHGAVSADAKFQLTQEAGVVVEEADVGCAGRIDVSRNRGGQKSLAIHQGEVVDLARLEDAIGNARLDMGVGDGHQPLGPARRCWLGAHATAGSSGSSPATGAASATIS